MYISGSDCKESACNAGDLGLIPGLERSPGQGHDNPFQYSCPENPTARGTVGWAEGAALTDLQFHFFAGLFSFLTSIALENIPPKYATPLHLRVCI